jgi:glycosyltransferase involved in cell wall biosynthesis
LLLVAGDGPDADRLRRIAPAEVRFLGAVAAEQVPGLIADASAMLVPSRWPEPAVPRAVLEAYATGVGVVGSAVGGMLEGVRDGETGYLVPPMDPGAWVSALRRFQVEGEAERLGEGARALWERRYSPDVGLQALEDAYAAVTDR